MIDHYLIQVAKHQRADPVTCLIERLRRHHAHLVGAIAQVGKELVEFRLDSAMTAREEEAHDRGQRQDALAGEVLRTDPLRREMLLKTDARTG